jgi:hypothetical protein
MRFKTVKTMLLLAGIGLGLSACYYPPAPGYGYYGSGYYDSGYYAAAPAYYGPSVGVYYGGGWGGGWHRDWDHDHRWR